MTEDTTDRDESADSALADGTASWPARIAVLLLFRSAQLLALAWLRAYELGWSLSDLWINWEAVHGPWRAIPWLGRPMSGAILASFCAYAAGSFGVLHRPTIRTIVVAAVTGVWCISLVGTHYWLVD
jgi:hypothetical protein